MSIAITITKTHKPKPKMPKRFEVLLLNDDYTPMDFVVAVLIRFFAKNEESANAIMLKVHADGEAVCGVFSHDVAQTKVSQVIDFARKHQQPLMCIIRALND